MKPLVIVILLLLALPVQALKACWNNPSMNTDGTPLTNLESITILVGTESGVWTPVKTIPTTQPGLKVCTVLRMPEGEYYMVALATNTDKADSNPSVEVVGTETRIPSPSGGELIGPSGGGLIISNEE